MVPSWNPFKVKMHNINLSYKIKIIYNNKLEQIIKKVSSNPKVNHFPKYLNITSTYIPNKQRSNASSSTNIRVFGLSSLLLPFLYGL